MDQYSVIFLNFDVYYGPKIGIQYGNIKLTDKQLDSLRFCSFPDSAISSFKKQLLFIFKIDQYYCYCIYEVKSDPSVARGFQQNSCVIVTNRNFSYPYIRMLISASRIGLSPDTAQLVSIFLSKWVNQFPKTPCQRVELPLLDGSLPIEYPPSFQKLFSNVLDFSYPEPGQNSPVYFINSHFMEFDLTTSLSVQSLFDQHRTFDILELWTSVILERSILVLGSTPAFASNAILTIGSLIAPYPIPPKIYPFISSMDKRFFSLISDKTLADKSIVGFSNPISIERNPPYSVIFKVGFDLEGNNEQKDGIIGSPKKDWAQLDSLTTITSYSIRSLLWENTQHLTSAIQDGIRESLITDPYRTVKEAVDAQFLERALVNRGVFASENLSKFAKDILKTSIFKQKLQKEITAQNIENALQNFNIKIKEQGKSDVDLVDMYSMVDNVSKQFFDNEKIQKYCGRDILQLKLLLTPGIKAESLA